MPHDTVFSDHRSVLTAVAYRVLGRWRLAISSRMLATTGGRRNKPAA